MLPLSSVREATVFPKSFSPFAHNRTTLMSRTLGLFSHIIVNVNGGATGAKLLAITGHGQLVSSLCTNGPHIRTRVCAKLANRFTRGTNTYTVVHNIEGAASFRCRHAVRTAGRHVCPSVAAMVLFAPSPITSVSSSAIHRILSFNHSIRRFVPGKVSVGGCLWARSL